MSAFLLWFDCFDIVLREMAPAFLKQWPMLNLVLHSSAFPIDMCPKNASYYGNRAATLMMLGRFREALGDAQQSVRLDDSFVRVCEGAFLVGWHWVAVVTFL